MTDRPPASDEIAARIDGLLARLRKDAEKRGRTFYTRPPSRVIPDFLEGHRPDALSIGPDGGSIVEIAVHR